MIDLGQLKVFVAAADEKNFSRAAKKLHMSQSAVSQNIQAIEKAFNVELFIRRGRSVILSEAGQTILPLAHDVLNNVRLFEDTLLNIEGHIGGDIVIGCSTTAGKYLLPNLIAAFRKQYPEVRVKVNVMSRMGVFERLVNEKVCMGILSKKVDHRDLELKQLFEDHVILIVPIDHPWAEYGQAMPSDLIDQPLILREESSGTREVMLEGLKAHGITPDMLNIIMELGNAEAIEMAVEEGIGIAFVSELVAARGLALGRVKKVDVQGLKLSRNVFMSRNIKYPFTRGQQLFWNYANERRQDLNSELWERLVGIIPAS